MSDIQQAIEAVARLREEATPGPWKAGGELYLLAQEPDGIARFLRSRDLKLAAAAPDLAASVEEMAKALVKIASEYPETASYKIPVAARAALAAFASRFSDEGRK